MNKVNHYLSLSILLIGLVLFPGLVSVPAQHEHHGETSSTNQTMTKNDQEKVSPDNQVTNSQQSLEPEIKFENSTLTLADLEKMALETNPTLRQADFSIRAAEGRKIQAGLLPNPIVGYSADDLSFRNFSDSGKHAFFIEQKIPLGGKLAKSRRIFGQEINKKEAEREAQNARVLNSVRLLYFEALGAQRQLEIKKELAGLAAESVDISAELYNVGLADQPDRLKTEILQSRAEAEYLEALNKFEEVWQKLGAVIGSPEMPPARLSGNLADFLGEVNAAALLTNLLANSPEIKAAQFEVEKAKAAVKRARAEKIPDLYLRGGVGYNNELIEDAAGRRRAGAEGFIEVGVTLPIFDRNQGGVSTAEAELAIAEREVDRLKLSLRTRFAQVLRNYRTSLLRADKYRTQIVPKAKAAYEMYSLNFAAMTASYTNVLSTRAAYLQAQLEYSSNLTAAQKSIVLLKGFLLSGGLNAPAETGAGSEESASLVSEENAVNEDDEDQQ